MAQGESSKSGTFAAVIEGQAQEQAEEKAVCPETQAAIEYYKHRHTRWSLACAMFTVAATSIGSSCFWLGRQRVHADNYVVPKMTYTYTDGDGVSHTEEMPEEVHQRVEELLDAVTREASTKLLHYYAEKGPEATLEAELSFDPPSETNRPEQKTDAGPAPGF